MKATGIVRRIDELGRVVIPKEIRKILNMNVNDPIEIFTGKEGTVVLKKYSLLGSINNIEAQCKTISNILNKPVFIFDTDNIISIGDEKFKFSGEKVSHGLYNSLSDRKPKFLNENNCVEVISGDKYTYKEQYICPVLSENSVVAGGVIVISIDGKLNELDKKVIEFISNVFSRQLS